MKGGDIHIRAATALDTRQMAGLLNEIIARGGTTAHTKPLTPDDIGDQMRLYPGQTAWFLAEDKTAQILGFQQIGPHPELPPEACDIATFVHLGQTGIGIASRLFEATKARAKRLGYAWINATIRADNDSGLIYYQSKGFETYKRLSNTRLGDGSVVDRICKRYDLSR